MSFNIPVSNGLLTPEHRAKIGVALWVFLWLLDRTTKEQAADGEMEGLVFGGSAVSASKIGEDLGEDVRAVRDHLARLEEHGYIRRIDHGNGKPWGYVVAKSKKWTYNPTEKTTGTLPEKPHTHAEKTVGPCGKNHRPIRKTLQDTTNSPVTKPLAQKTRGDVDPRRKDFIDDLKKYREHLTGPGSFSFTGKDASNLDVWLKEHPKVSRDTFQQCLNHRARSDINAAEEIFRWIGRVLEYSEGPLDRYGKPKAGSENGKHGTNPKDEVIAEIGQSVLERRRARRATPGEIGMHAESVAVQAAYAGGD